MPTNIGGNRLGTKSNREENGAGDLIYRRKHYDDGDDFEDIHVILKIT